MAGKILAIIPTRTFDFTGLAPGSADYVLKRGIDVTGWRSASLIVKVQALSIAFAEGGFTIAAQLEGPTKEEPGADFISTALLGSIVMTNTMVIPNTVVAPLGATLGSTLRVLLQVTNTSGGGAPTLTGTFSVDLCLRSG